MTSIREKNNDYFSYGRFTLRWETRKGKYGTKLKILIFYFLNGLRLKMVYVQKESQTNQQSENEIEERCLTQLAKTVPLFKTAHFCSWKEVAGSSR